MAAAPFLFKKTMSVANKLRKLYPELDTQIEKEETLRKVAVISDLLPLLGTWVKPLTPRIGARLEFAGSPFLDGRRAMLRDVAMFMWLVHPRWMPDNELSWFRTPRAKAERVRIEYMVARCDLWHFEAEIRQFVLDNYQDAPGCRDEDYEGPRCYGPVISASLCMKEWGLSFEQYMDTPVLILNQLFRVYQHANDAGRPLNKSDGIVGRIIKDLWKKE